MIPCEIHFCVIILNAAWHQPLIISKEQLNLWHWQRWLSTCGSILVKGSFKDLKHNPFSENYQLQVTSKCPGNSCNYICILTVSLVQLNQVALNKLLFNPCKTNGHVGSQMLKTTTNLSKNGHSMKQKSKPKPRPFLLSPSQNPNTEYIFIPIAVPYRSVNKILCQLYMHLNQIIRKKNCLVSMSRS